ncbi:putative pre-16S rRNA nuclease [Synergistales bacterium]|nr:putative pre-16S rRNA nuclease [Synergistales bacterium]
MPSKRVLALDIGTVRIGVAVTDPLCLFAQGVDVWPIDGWRTCFEESLAKYDPRIVLIGLPKRTTGEYGPEEAKMEELAAELREAYPDRAFETYDERFTTVMAQRALIEGNVSRAKRKGRVDKVAATIILQSWLDSVSAHT